MLLSLAIRNVWTRAPSASSTAFVYRATAAGAAASPGLDSFAFTAVKKRVEADPTDIAAAWIGLTMSAACGCNVDGIPAKAGLADANSINESTAVSNGFAKICAWKWIHCVRLRVVHGMHVCVSVQQVFLLVGIYKITFI